MKKILIDATNITNYPTGAGNYAIHILKRLKNKKNVDILVSKDLSLDHIIYTLDFNILALPISAIGFKRDLKLFTYFYNIKKEYKTYFSFMPYSPLFFSFDKQIITIHDLGHIHHKSFLPWYKLWYFVLNIKQAVKKATKIITVSETSKKDIKKYFKTTKEVIVATNAVEVFDKSKYLFPKSIKNNKRYILHVGEHRSHKNILRLIEAFAQLKNKKGTQDIQLVLVGKEYKDSKQKIDAMITSFLHIKNDVHVFNRVTDQQLYEYYAHASVFILPSLYEGFGIPLLEAMIFDVPVITSNRSATKEVVGDAALLVDPLDINDISQSIHKVLFNNDIKNDLIKKGKERAKYYSWEKTAKIIEKIIQ